MITSFQCLPSASGIVMGQRSKQIVLLHQSASLLCICLVLGWGWEGEAEGSWETKRSSCFLCRGPYFPSFSPSFL